MRFRYSCADTFQSLRVSITTYKAHFSDPMILSDIQETPWFVSVFGSGDWRRSTLQASLASLTLSRRWSALGHCGMNSQNLQVFPSYYQLRINRGHKGGIWRLLHTMLIGLKKKKKKTEVGRGSQQLTNGYYVPGTLLDALGTSSHVIFTIILGGGSCFLLSKDENHGVQRAQMMYFRSLSKQ